MYYKHHLLLLIFVLLISSSQSNKFSDCATTSISCADSNRNISYPFRIPAQPDYCGHPDFELDCIGNNSVLELTISEKQYKVIGIRYDLHLFGISQVDYWTDSCPETFSNTTIDFSLFNYSDNGMNMTLFFNCSPLIDSSAKHVRNIPCLSNSTSNQSYYNLPNDGSLPPALEMEMYEKCLSVILIPTSKDIKEFLVKGRLDFLGVLQNGFALNWIVGNGWCGECMDSGGVCGNDPNSLSAPACFCSDGRVTSGTCPGTGTSALRYKRIIIDDRIL